MKSPECVPRPGLSSLGYVMASLVLVIFATNSAMAGSVWDFPGEDGSWNNTDRWTGGIPNAPGAEATIALNSNYLKKIYLENQVTLKSLQLTPLAAATTYIEGRGNSFVMDSGEAPFPSLLLDFTSATTGKLIVDANFVSEQMIYLAANGNVRGEFRGSITSDVSIQANYSGSTAISYLDLGRLSAPNVNLSANGQGTVTIELASDVSQLQISGSSFQGKTRLDLDAGFIGAVSWKGGDLELAGALKGSQLSSTVTGKDIRLAEGGQITIGGAAGNLNASSDTDLVLAGGALLANSVALNLTSGQMVVEKGSSRVQLSGSQLNFLSYNQSSRKGVVLVESAGLATSSRILFAGTAPTLSGGGTAGTAQVGILPGMVLYDGTSQYNFATYQTFPTGVRALAAAEYSTTLASGNNVRLTANGASNYSGAINSLLLNDSVLSGSGAFSISSGMIVAYGSGSSGISKALFRTADLHVYNSQQLSIYNSAGTGDIIKSGTGDLYWASSQAENFIVNEGKLILTAGNHLSATVGSGGILRTYLSSGFNGTPGQIHLDKGAVWELDNGTLQRASVLDGGGTVQGKGTTVNNLQFWADTNDDLDVVLEGNLRLELIGSSNTAMTWSGSGSSHTGDTQLGSVAVKLVDNNTLSASSIVKILNSSSLDLQGTNQTVAGLENGGGSGGANLMSDNTSAPATLTINVANEATEHIYNGNISNGVNIVKTGAGTQTFNTSSSGLGAVVVQEGAVKMQTIFNSFGANASFRVQSGATLSLDVQTSGPLLNKVRLESNGNLEWVRPYMDPFHNQLNFEHADGRQTKANILAINTLSDSLHFSFQTSGDALLHSDVLRMDGIDSLNGDRFVLQLSYNPADLTGDGEFMMLGWSDNGVWVNAVLGNSAGVDTFYGDQTWSEDIYDLGSWGYDSANGQVWAVLDHNSQFAVMMVPEPSTYLLFCAGLGFLVLGHRREASRIRT